MAWYECPFCFEVFEAKYSNVSAGHVTSCGCRNAHHGKNLTATEKSLVEWLRAQIKENKPENIPPLLRKLVGVRRVDPTWNPDVDLNFAKNFLECIGKRPVGGECGWEDPTGPMAPENFKWKFRNARKA